MPNLTGNSENYTPPKFLAELRIGLLEEAPPSQDVRTQHVSAGPSETPSQRSLSCQPRKSFDQHGTELLGHLQSLWWPELTLCPVFLYFGLRNISTLPFAVALAGFIAIGARKFNALGHIRQLLVAGAAVLRESQEPRNQWQHAKGDSLEAAMQTEMDKPDEIPLLFCFGPELPWKKKWRTYWLSLPNCVEMLLSCNATGASWLAWRATAESSWCASWTPVVGGLLACHTSLPIVLTLLLGISIGTHTIGFNVNSRRAKKILEELENAEGAAVFHCVKNFLVAVTAAADSANLLLISHVTYAGSWSISGSGGNGRDRTMRFMLKVGPCVGNAPGLWFKVSALQHLYVQLGMTGRLSVIASIVMVVYSSIEPFAQQVSFLRTLPWQFVGKPNNPSYFTIFLNFFSLIAASILFAFSFVRLWGVWHCPSHIFQIWGLECL